MDERRLDRAITILVDKINESVAPDKALKYTQAALNLVHAKETIVACRIAGVRHAVQCARQSKEPNSLVEMPKGQQP